MVVSSTEEKRTSGPRTQIKEENPALICHVWSEESKMAGDVAGKFRFAIDRGGTFTDVYSECPNGKVRVMKLLSVDPAYPDAPREGIRRILEQVITKRKQMI